MYGKTTFANFSTNTVKESRFRGFEHKANRFSNRAPISLKLNAHMTLSLENFGGAGPFNLKDANMLAAPKGTQSQL